MRSSRSARLGIGVLLPVRTVRVESLGRRSDVFGLIRVRPRTAGKFPSLALRCAPPVSLLSRGRIKFLPAAPALNSTSPRVFQVDKTPGRTVPFLVRAFGGAARRAL